MAPCGAVSCGLEARTPNCSRIVTLAHDPARILYQPPLVRVNMEPWPFRCQLPQPGRLIDRPFSPPGVVLLPRLEHVDFAVVAGWPAAGHVTHCTLR